MDKALAEKERLLPIKTDLEQAQKQLQEYEQLLKEGKTLPVNADVTQAKAALDKLTTYAKENSLLELRVTTEKAQASITNVEGMIRALDRINTESKHNVSTNADAARSEIQSLNGQNTSSTHTIYVTKVETNATGGLVGRGLAHFAVGGAVAPAFARMSGGRVPGSGDQDTVPRTLDAGAFVLRKAAVRKYGGSVLSKLANSVAGGFNGVTKFATGGSVSPDGNSVKRNKDAVEAKQMIELGLQSMREYTNWMRSHYGASLSIGFEWDTLKSYGEQAQTDCSQLESMVGRKTLTANERQKVDAIKQTWRQAMAQPLLWGKDVERDLMDYMEQHQGEFYRGGGMAKSDTVPAMLTPGEFVVNRSAVARFGAGLFESLNNLTLPVQALAQHVQGFAIGGLVSPATMVTSMARPVLETPSSPTRTVRVELAAGGRQVSAQIDERDEGRLLQILQSAQMRAA